MIIFYFMFSSKSKYHLYGSARWMSFWERCLFFSPWNKGLIVGNKRISLSDSYKHLVLMAPTGAGKTSSFVIPNVLGLKNASCIVTDPSGEIFATTSGVLYDRGFNISVLDLRNPLTSLRFNPLSRVKSASDIKKVIASLFLSAFPVPNAEQSFWNELASSVLYVILSCLRREGERYFNFHNARYILNRFGSSGRDIDAFILRNTEDDQALFFEYKSFLSNDDKVLLGAVSTAKSLLEKFSDHDLAMVSSGDDFSSFGRMRSQPSVLYIVVPEHLISYYGFYLSLFYGQVFESVIENYKETELPLFILLDEFGNLGHINNFPALITTLRKRRVSVSLILQDYQQLVSVYGSSGASVIYNGGCGSKLFMPGLSYEVCHQIENMLGKSTVSYSEEGYHKSGADSLTSRDNIIGSSLLSSDQVRVLKDRQAIFIHGNKYPALLKTSPFYKRRFRHRPVQSNIINSSGELKLVSL